MFGLSTASDAPTENAAAHHVRVLPARSAAAFSPRFCSSSVPTTARAQVTDATVKGRVVDASGDILPGAVVTARHADTGIRREATSDAAGTFLLAGLTPGVYSLGADVAGFRPFSQDGLRLTVGETADVTITLGLANVQESVEVTAGAVTVAVSREGRLSDTFGRTEVQNLPLPQRDVFLLPRMSAGAAFIPGAANSTKLSSSPVIAVNGNRYRGNNYVLDGAMNTNPNNTGEPAIVPALEAVEEVQVQTLNFAAEFGRGNGAVINVQTRSGTNQVRGRAWEYFRSDALNARNYFSATTPPQTFNQFGTTLGGPILRNQTFFFGSYEGTRNQVERPFAFQVETPELRDYVLRTAPDSVAARLLRDFPAPAPDRGSDGALPRSARAGDAGRHHPGDRPRQRPDLGRRPLRPVPRARRPRARHDAAPVGALDRRAPARRGRHQLLGGDARPRAARQPRPVRGLLRQPQRRRAADPRPRRQRRADVLPDHQHDARCRGRGRADRQHHRHHRAVRRRLREHDAAAHVRDPRRADARARRARHPRRRGSAAGHQGPVDRPADRRLVHVHDAGQLRRRSAVPPAADRRSGHAASRPPSRATSRSTSPACSSRTSGRSTRGSASASACATTTSAP